MRRLGAILSILAGTRGAGAIVPPSGFTARLTLFAAGAMAFLAVFALALSLSAGRLAGTWEAGLARTATVRVPGSAAEIGDRTEAVLSVLAETAGIAAARRLEPAERQALLAPWFGPDLPLDALPMPEMVEVTLTDADLDAEGLRVRLEAAAPGAVFDDHARWREPVVRAAERLRGLGFLALALTGAATAAMIALAAQSSLSANRRVVEVLRLVGARDAFIARAFVRRFTLRALTGAAVGAALATLAVALLPETGAEGGVLAGAGFRGAGWLWPLAVPPFAAAAAFLATRFAAFRLLREMP